MTTLPYIKIYPDFINVVQELDNGARGRLLLAIMQYANGEEPDELTGAERIAYIVLKGQIDRDADAYEANAKKQSENGKKGGRPKKDEKIEKPKKPTAFSENPKNPPLFSETQRKPKKPEKEKEEEKEEDKNKKEKENKSVRETTHALFKRLLPDYILSDSLQAKMSEWVKYKNERKEPYTEQGMKSLLRQVENKAMQYGDDAVCSLIDECMANNWKGIIFDRLQQNQRKPASGGYHRQTKAEELDDFYTMAENWSET